MDISRSNPCEENRPAEQEDGHRKTPSPKTFGSKAKKRKKPAGAGARVIRSAGGKDRHSKVSTAMGTKDRRVRLSPRTAIQFYDVQDRLGYDRPSKAIDWLMSEARDAIDALNLPPPPAADISRSHNCPAGFGFENPHPPENFCFYMNGDSEFQVYNSDVSFAWNYGNSPQPAQFPAEPPPVLPHEQIWQREPLQSSFSRIPNENHDRFPGVEYLEMGKIQFSSAPFLHYEE